MSTQPFTINVPQATIDDLRERLQRTRWPGEVAGAGWDYGTNLAYMKELVAYWRNGFDWRAQEAILNGFAQFRAEVDGFGLHFVHERGKGPNPQPILLLHGWPDSFFRMHKLIPLLTDPASHGADAADSFDVVVPSLPGFGFSDKPITKGFTSERTVALLASLMTETLGYKHFAVHGGDIGSGLTELFAYQHADKLTGVHLTDVPYWHLFAENAGDLSQAEQQYIEAGRQWQMTEGAYAMIQSTKPQTLAYALNDSPVGLAAWIVEKFRSWSDCGGDVESRFSKEELLTNIMIYWATQTIGSSFLPYYEGAHGQPKAAGKHSDVPVGVAIFPHDLVPAPREYGERVLNIQRWADMPRGGHFAALEEPELLAADIRAFYRGRR